MIPQYRANGRVYKVTPSGLHSTENRRNPYYADIDGRIYRITRDGNVVRLFLRRANGTFPKRATARMSSHEFSLGIIIPMGKKYRSANTLNELGV